MPKGWAQSEFIGHHGVAEAICRVRNAFGDWHEEVQDMVIEAQKAMTRYVSTGTHGGLFLGVPARGRRVRIDEMSIYHLRAGFVVEQWCLTDDLTMAKSLGLLG
jgi:predicted ester cyclase